MVIGVCFFMPLEVGYGLLEGVQRGVEDVYWAKWRVQPSIVMPSHSAARLEPHPTRLALGTRGVAEAQSVAEHLSLMFHVDNCLLEGAVRWIVGRELLIRDLIQYSRPRLGVRHSTGVYDGRSDDRNSIC